MLEFDEPSVNCPICDREIIDMEEAVGLESEERVFSASCWCGWEGVVTVSLNVEVYDKRSHKVVPETPKMRERWHGKNVGDYHRGASYPHL